MKSTTAVRYPERDRPTRAASPARTWGRERGLGTRLASGDLSLTGQRISAACQRRHEVELVEDRARDDERVEVVLAHAAVDHVQRDGQRHPDPGDHVAEAGERGDRSHRGEAVLRRRLDRVADVEIV